MSEREDRIKRAQKIREKATRKAAEKGYCGECIPGMTRMILLVGKGKVCARHEKPLPEYDPKQIRK